MCLKRGWIHGTARARKVCPLEEAEVLQMREGSVKEKETDGRCRQSSEAFPS